MQNRGGWSSLGYVAGPQTGRGRAKGGAVGEAGDGAAAARRGDGNQPPRFCMLPFQHGSTIIVLAPAGYHLFAHVAESAPIKMGQPLMQRPE